MVRQQQMIKRILEMLWGEDGPITVGDLRLAKLGVEYYLHGYTLPIILTESIHMSPSTKFDDMDRRFITVVDRNHIRHIMYLNRGSYCAIVID